MLSSSDSKSKGRCKAKGKGRIVKGWNKVTARDKRRWFESTWSYHEVKDFDKILHFAFCILHFFGGVAQLGEHLPCKQGVMGSNPIISTKEKRGIMALNQTKVGFEYER